MKAKPLSDKVVVKPIETDTESKGGILLPQNKAENSTQGTVVAVGPGRRTKDGNLVPITIKVDDRILISSNAGHKVKIDGEDLVIVNEDDVFAILED